MAHAIIPSDENLTEVADWVKKNFGLDPNGVGRTIEIPGAFNEEGQMAIEFNIRKYVHPSDVEWLGGTGEVKVI